MTVTPDLSSRSARRPQARARRFAHVSSLTLVEGARRRLELARDCIEQGSDPGRRLRAAMRRITRLPASLERCDGEAIAHLAELSAYMCRELSAVCRTGDSATLGRMCDLLREIRTAWVALPPASTLCNASGRVMRM
jgi:flagellin-specific chaperone FliS